jgi:hypothetical protein
MSIHPTTKKEYSKIHDAPKTYVEFDTSKTQSEISKTLIHLLISDTKSDDKIGLYKNSFVNICSAWSRDNTNTIEFEKQKTNPTIKFDTATTELQIVAADTTVSSITLTEPLLEKFCVLREIIIGDYIPNWEEKLESMQL